MHEKYTDKFWSWKVLVRTGGKSCGARKALGDHSVDWKVLQRLAAGICLLEKPVTWCYLAVRAPSAVAVMVAQVVCDLGPRDLDLLAHLIDVLCTHNFLSQRSYAYDVPYARLASRERTQSYSP